VLFRCLENVMMHFSFLGSRRVAVSGRSGIYLKSRGSIPGGKDALARFDLSDEGRVMACAVIIDLQIGRAARVPISQGC
jgi:hypothetical protein